MGDQFAQDCLKAHNEYRRKHGAQPLVLDSTISAFSQQWANTIAARNSMVHSKGSGYGENIYASMGMAVNGRTAADSWYSEIKDYRYGSGFSSGTGHFTQLVWKGSTKMGVGKATNGSGWTYVVANYSPAGNMQGAFTANVLPPGNYNIPDTSKPKKTGLEGEVCDIVSKKCRDSVESIAEHVLQHLEAKKPSSLWIVGVVSDSKAAQSQNTVKGFVNYDLGDSENKDLAVYEFEHPHDVDEAKATVLNDSWINKVKLAFLEAQRSKTKAAEVLEKAAELFPELKNYQRIIFKDADSVSWMWKKSTPVFYFGHTIGDWFVVLIHPSKPPKALPTPDPSPINQTPTGSIDLEKEVCGIVKKKCGETVESIVDQVYQHLEARKPNSLWIVVLVSGSKSVRSTNVVKGFVNYDLGDKEDKDLAIYEFEHPHDEAKAKENVDNEEWCKQVESAFLEAQEESEKAKEILKNAEDIFAEIIDYQRIIFKVDGDGVSWQWKKNQGLFFFAKVIGDRLVVLVEPPKSPLANSMTNLQLNEPSGPSSGKKLCTFVTGKGALIEQHMYNCATCEMNDEDTCICKVCVKLCHKGHDVSMAKMGKSFCDCGSDDTGICKANKE